MVDKKFRKALDAYLNEVEESSVLLDNPSFDKSIVGITDDYRIVYDYDKMVDELSKDDHIDPMEAEDFISYDTMRAIGYMEDPKPIILTHTKKKIIDFYYEEEKKEEK